MLKSLRYFYGNVQSFIDHIFYLVNQTVLILIKRTKELNINCSLTKSTEKSMLQQKYAHELLYAYIYPIPTTGRMRRKISL